MFSACVEVPSQKRRVIVAMCVSCVFEAYLSFICV